MRNLDFYVFTYSGKPIGESGENCGTIYDLDNSCHTCGTGAKVKGNLRSNNLDKRKSEIFQTIDGDYIISEKLFNKMISENINVCSLKKVMDKKGIELPYYQLFAEIDLPKAKKTKGLIKESQCLVCNRNGYFNNVNIGNLNTGVPTTIAKVELVYKKYAAFSETIDVLNSWEHMGLSNKNEKGNMVVRYARPLLIVSETLKRFLEKENLKNLKFEPIKILEET